MLVSVIMPTMRVGGIDILADSLQHQTSRDFELVLVDGLHARRAGIVAEKAKSYNFPIRHVAPPPVFPLNAFCSYANTGLVAASGEVALFCVDFTELPPGLVEMHADFHKRDSTGRAGLMAPHQYYELEVHPEFPRYSNTNAADTERYASDAMEGRLDQFMWSLGRSTGRIDSIMRDTDPKLKLPDGPIHPVFFHAKNESVRLEHCLAINGWDEDLDGTHPYQDSDFSDRLTVHRGVQWSITSRPEAVARIVNPRHAFPYARRLRTPESNYEIWQRKKAAGYPGTVNKWNLRERRMAVTVGPMLDAQVDKQFAASHAPTAVRRRLKLAMVYGAFSSAIHGPFDLPNLADAGLTGSESSFFNLARTLGERGHQVVMFCDSKEPVQLPSGVFGVPLQAVQGLPEMQLDAVIAWNEPDYLKYAPKGAARILDQQLNDWGYCKEDPTVNADLFVYPSDSSKRNHATQLSGHTYTVIPNSVDLALFDGPAPERNPRRVVYASSPDRGLHHLLSWWPTIRQRVPDAELKIFYRIGPWLERAWNSVDSEVSRRAIYIEEVFRKLRVADFGVEVVGAVSNREMARQFRMAAVLAYPCDPVRYTEGFGCSVLDACAGGCVPIISDADALGEVHGIAALVIANNKRPSDRRETWIQHIDNELSRRAPKAQLDAMAAHAAANSREKVTDHWERLLLEVSTSRG